MKPLPNDPVFVTCDPAEHAANFADRLTALGCSPEYVAAAKLDKLAHTVQVDDPEKGNQILCGRE